MIFHRLLSVVFLGCLLSFSVIATSRRRRGNAPQGSRDNRKEDMKKKSERNTVLFTDSLNPSQEELQSALPHLASSLRNKDNLSDEEEMKLNSQIRELVEDVRFAVNNFGDVSLEKAAALDKLGRVVFKLGKYEELIELSHEIVSIKESILGVDHKEVGGALKNIGTLYCKLDRLEEATRVLLRSLRIHKLHYQEGSKELALMFAKMHQCGLSEKFHSEGLTYEEYMGEEEYNSAEL